MWIWWTKTNPNPSILGRLSVIKWRNWAWWESYLNTAISAETQIAVVAWPQWILGKISHISQNMASSHNTASEAPKLSLSLPVCTAHLSNRLVSFSILKPWLAACFQEILNILSRAFCHTRPGMSFLSRCSINHGLIRWRSTGRMYRLWEFKILGTCSLELFDDISVIVWVKNNAINIPFEKLKLSY